MIGPFDSHVLLCEPVGTQKLVSYLDQVIYIAAGSSVDLFYGITGVVYSYAAEVRGDSFQVRKLISQTCLPAQVLAINGEDSL